MNNESFSQVVKKLDWTLIFMLFVIHVIALLNLYSATVGPGGLGISNLFKKQIVAVGIGWVLFFMITFSQLHYLQRLAPIIYLVNLILLVLTLLAGKTALGAQRWIHLGPLSFQPSETMKIATIVAIAQYLSTRSHQQVWMGLKEMIFLGLVIFLPVGLIIKQPDLGTAMSLTLITVSMILIRGVKKWIVFISIGLGLVLLPIVWEYGLKDYQKKRVYTFLAPEADPRGSGYNSIQSKISIGSGQILGKGYLRGTQSKLEFLPEHHTDFIFSVLSEEHGFFGSIGVITLIMLLLIVSTVIVSQASDTFHLMLGIGAIMYVFWHFFINIGMVTGLLPVVGIPLPFFSYGGTSFITSMIALGIVSNIAYRRYIFKGG